MDKKCPNCGEPRGECACMRNKCIDCGKPVGNITFSVCDDCWDKTFKVSKKGWVKLNADLKRQLAEVNAAKDEALRIASRAQEGSCVDCVEVAEAKEDAAEFSRELNVSGGYVFDLKRELAVMQRALYFAVLTPVNCNECQHEKLDSEGECIGSCIDYYIDRARAEQEIK